jgi:hypothetical protein
MTAYTLIAVANGEAPAVLRAGIAPHWAIDLWRRHPYWIVAAGAVLALAVIVALIWPVTDLIAAHDVGLIAAAERAAALQKAREATRTQLLTLGGAIFAAGALIFTARNYTLSRRTVELTQETFKLTEQEQITDRYTKAIEQLGSEHLDVRIGAVYALERIARDSAYDHPTVMQVLTAFIRENSRKQWLAPGTSAGSTYPATRPDVQAAVTVIGRRDERLDHNPIDLSHAQLPYANLAHAKLRGANLDGANLDSANLNGANLNGATLRNHASLRYAWLYDADLGNANLIGANLSGDHFSDTKYRKLSLRGAALSFAILKDADLREADLHDATLSDADLSGARLPEHVGVPPGWERNAIRDTLQRVSSNPGSKETPAPAETVE